MFEQKKRGDCDWHIFVKKLQIMSVEVEYLDTVPLSNKSPRKSVSKFRYHQRSNSTDLYGWMDGLNRTD